MKIIEEPGGRSIEIRKGGGCIMLFGLPFMLAGLAVIGGALGVLGPKADGFPTVFGVLFGLVFVVVGGTVAFWRGGISLDRHGNVSSWWGILVPWQKVEAKISEFDAVRVSKEVRRSNNSTYTVYPVCLFSDAAKDIKFKEPTKYEEARQLSERLAKFTGLKLIDASTGSEVVREADKLDTPLRDQLRQEGPVELPEAPSNLRSTIRSKGRDIMIELPPSSGALLAKLMLIPFLIIPVIMGAVFFSMFSHSGNGSRFASFLFVLFPVILVVPMIFLWRRKSAAFSMPQRLIVSPEQGVRLECVAKNGSITVRGSIPVRELEEIVVPEEDITSLAGSRGGSAQVPEFVKGLAAAMGKTGMVLRSDNASLVFGGTLDREELLYLERVIEHTLVE